LAVNEFYGYSFIWAHASWVVDKQFLMISLLNLRILESGAFILIPGGRSLCPVKMGWGVLLIM